MLSEYFENVPQKQRIFLERLNNLFKTTKFSASRKHISQSQFKNPANFRLFYNLLRNEILIVHQANKVPKIDLSRAEKKYIIRLLFHFLHTYNSFVISTSLLVPIGIVFPSAVIALFANNRQRIRSRIIKRKTIKRVRNATNASWLRKSIFIKIRKFDDSGKKVYDSLKKTQLKKVRYGHVFIRIKHNNTFINLSNRYGQVKYTCSAGLLGYKGKKKKTYFAKKALGRLISKTAQRKYYYILDINLISGLGRLYKPILSGLISMFVVIRLIRAIHTHPHGYTRLRKQRRI